MKAHTHLIRDKRGPDWLVEQYGDALLCVRYRYDAIRSMRLKTVELIVDEKPGKPVSRH